MRGGKEKNGGEGEGKGRKVLYRIRSSPFGITPQRGERDKRKENRELRSVEEKQRERGT